jgi:hypothetical protein
MKQKYAADRIRVARLLTGTLFPDPARVELGDVDRSILNKNFIAHVHAKSYSEDPEQGPASLQMHYSHVLWQLFLSRYEGYYSIEYEGQQGYHRIARYEPEEADAGADALKAGSTDWLDPRERRATTQRAIKNLDRLIHDTYNNYRRDMREPRL